jgi:hypothetical protein
MKPEPHLPATIEWNEMPPTNIGSRLRHGIKAVLFDLHCLVIARFWLWRAAHGI